MADELGAQQSIADWGLQISRDPVKMQTNVLPAPQMVTDK